MLQAALPRHGREKTKLASLLERSNDAFTKADGALEASEEVLVLPVFCAYLKVDEIPGIPRHHHSLQ